MPTRTTIRLNVLPNVERAISRLMWHTIRAVPAIAPLMHALLDMRDTRLARPSGRWPSGYLLGRRQGTTMHRAMVRGLERMKAQYQRAITGGNLLRLVNWTGCKCARCGANAVETLRKRGENIEARSTLRILGRRSTEKVNAIYNVQAEFYCQRLKFQGSWRRAESAPGTWRTLDCQEGPGQYIPIQV